MYILTGTLDITPENPIQFNEVCGIYTTDTLSLDTLLLHFIPSYSILILYHHTPPSHSTITLHHHTPPSHPTITLHHHPPPPHSIITPTFTTFTPTFRCTCSRAWPTVAPSPSPFAVPPPVRYLTTPAARWFRRASRLYPQSAQGGLSSSCRVPRCAAIPAAATRPP
jgi:hypothetical protein